MTDDLELEAVLQALDETPQTANRLARRLDADPTHVRTVLEQAREEGMAADWGHVWATTWRAKLTLAPRFFKIWIPASLAVGAGLTAIAFTIHGPYGARWETAGPLALVALAAAGLALVPWLRDARR